MRITRALIYLEAEDLVGTLRRQTILAVLQALDNLEPVQIARETLDGKPEACRIPVPLLFREDDFTLPVL
jgi:hypothetical protein